MQPIALKDFSVLLFVFCRFTRWSSENHGCKRAIWGWWGYHSNVHSLAQQSASKPQLVHQRRTGKFASSKGWIKTQGFTLSFNSQTLSLLITVKSCFLQNIPFVSLLPKRLFVGSVVNFCSWYWDIETELILTESRTSVSSVEPDLRFIEGHQISSHAILLKFFTVHRLLTNHNAARKSWAFLLVRYFAPESLKKLQWLWLECLYSDRKWKILINDCCRTLPISLPYVCLSFTKLRFRRSFWDAEGV